MFKQSFRNKLREQSWLEVTKEGGNEHQSWRRIKNNTQRTIDDLVLLYEKLPQEKRDELFNLQNFRKLFGSLLTPYEHNNVTKLNMAEDLLKSSIFLFKREFASQHKNTLVLKGLVGENLDKSVEICRDILYLKKRNKITLPKSKEKIAYLCSWSEVRHREKGNLTQYISDKFGLFPFEFKMDRNLSNEFEINGKFEDQGGEKYIFQIKIDELKEHADLSISDNRNNTVEEQLILKKQDEDYILYYQTSPE